MADADELDEEDIETPKPSKLPLILAALTAFILGGGAGFGGSAMMDGETDQVTKIGEDGQPIDEAAEAEAKGRGRWRHSRRGRGRCGARLISSGRGG